MNIKERAQEIIKIYGPDTIAAKFATEVIQYVEYLESKNKLEDSLRELRVTCVNRLKRFDEVTKNEDHRTN